MKVWFEMYRRRLLWVDGKKQRQRDISVAELSKGVLFGSCVLIFWRLFNCSNKIVLVIAVATGKAFFSF